jgi:MraZ protein
VAELFRGTSEHSVDQKGRVSIPVAFRRVLEDGDPGWYARRPEPPFMVMVENHLDNPCLGCFTVRSMEALETAVLAVRNFAVRNVLAEQIGSAATRLQLDENGRIVLPQRLRAALGLRDTVRFVAKLDHFEIWAPEAHDAHRARRAERFDAARQARPGDSIYDFIELGAPAVTAPGVAS